MLTGGVAPVRTLRPEVPASLEPYRPPVPAEADRPPPTVVAPVVPDRSPPPALVAAGPRPRPVAIDWAAGSRTQIDISLRELLRTWWPIILIAVGIGLFLTPERHKK